MFNKIVCVFSLFFILGSFVSQSVSIVCIGFTSDLSWWIHAKCDANNWWMNKTTTNLHSEAWIREWSTGVHAYSTTSIASFSFLIQLKCLLCDRTLSWAIHKPITKLIWRYDAPRSVCIKLTETFINQKRLIMIDTDETYAKTITNRKLLNYVEFVSFLIVYQFIRILWLRSNYWHDERIASGLVHLWFNCDFMNAKRIDVLVFICLLWFNVNC